MFRYGSGTPRVRVVHLVTSIEMVIVSRQICKESDSYYSIVMSFARALKVRTA